MPRLLPLLMVLALAACQLALPGKSGDAPAKGNPITGAAIEVTSLDAAPVTEAAVEPAAETTAETTAEPAADPAVEAPAEPAAEASADAATDPATDPAAEAEAAPPPPPPKSPDQLACERKGGTYATAGSSGGKACVKRTRDGGKQCRKESDCEGFCLARSNSCAPITPMFGCNDILQNDGRKVTLCID
ncbi:hypothetical protein [Rhodobacter ferrooxidans]|uniref:Uncharacterized protein n=1 Tax=Rhodobacter ferrooxidans TaxID=371731 RepID=C8S045_9RHOB|nr:hypothetical protein [Rhodobacter sp. SW2]EEW25654.1 hypothetical protein Rsw2DRAFT_1423 [Rhodobacter sp. SW2]